MKRKGKKEDASKRRRITVMRCESVAKVGDLSKCKFLILLQLFLVSTPGAQG